jgi:hypothetical protein
MMKERELQEMTTSEEVDADEAQWDSMFERNIMTIEEWKESCDENYFIDYDGFGEMLTKAGDVYIPHGRIYPSERHKTPALITHIEWFNR